MRLYLHKIYTRDTRVSCSHCDKQKFIEPLSVVAPIDAFVVIVIIIVTIRT